MAKLIQSETEDSDCHLLSMGLPCWDVRKWLMTCNTFSLKYGCGLFYLFADVVDRLKNPINMD